MDGSCGTAPNSAMSRKTFGSWSRAERIAAVGVVVAVLAVGALVLNRPSSGPALAAGWTRVPIAPWSFTIKGDYQGSTDCNPITQTLDDAAYYNADATTRYVSLHVVDTGSGADSNLTDCGGSIGYWRLVRPDGPRGPSRSRSTRMTTATGARST